MYCYCHIHLSHHPHEPFRISTYGSDTASGPESDLKIWDASDFSLQLPHTVSEDSGHDLVGRAQDVYSPIGVVFLETILQPWCPDSRYPLDV